MDSNVTLERDGHVATVWLDRAEKRNAMTAAMWEALPKALEDADGDPEVRVVILAGRGTSFTAGIDLEFLAGLGFEGGTPDATRKQRLYRGIRRLQLAVSSLETCSKPVIAAIHGWCLGAGIDLITACDIRLAAADAVFSVRETRMAMVADLGTLQRLPRIVSRGHLAELVYTGRDIDAYRARDIGLVNEIYPDQETLMKSARSLADEIAANSPLAVQGSKAVIRAAEGKSVEDALELVAMWNAAFIDSRDLREALAAFVEKRDPRFTGE
jgi:enoyl-CoA hydratase